MIRTATFGQTVVTWDGDHVTTTLPDGARVEAVAHDTDAYRETARRLGYGDDVARLNREHDPLHAALAAWLGLPCSPTLRNVADGGGNGPLFRLEETAVCAVQTFANALGIDLVETLFKPR